MTLEWRDKVLYRDGRPAAWILGSGATWVWGHVNKTALESNCCTTYATRLEAELAAETATNEKRFG